MSLSNKIRDQNHKMFIEAVEFENENSKIKCHAQSQYIKIYHNSSELIILNSFWKKRILLSIIQLQIVLNFQWKLMFP